jgi:menaquinone-dependent protoporphyrinogen oxidase
MTILVAAASRHGATAEIAEVIGEVLAAQGVAVEVLAIEEVDDLTPYSAVILGSAVYHGQWLGHARQFLDDHDRELAERPTWLFSSGPVGGAARSHRPGRVDQVDEVAAGAPAIEHRFFAGRLEPGAVGGFGPLAGRFAGLRVGDYRDFEEIRAWAASIAGELTNSLGRRVRPDAARTARLERSRMQRAVLASTRRERALLWLISVMGMWVVFFGVLAEGRMGDLWLWIRDLPFVAEAAAWVVFLPLMAGMAVWNSTWPEWFRIVLVGTFAAFWILTARSAAAAAVPEVHNRRDDGRSGGTTTPVRRHRTAA